MNCFIAAILGGVLLLSSPRNPTEPVPVTLESSECCQSAELSVKLECEPMHVARVQPEVDIQCIEWEPAAERKTTLTEKEYYVLAKLLYAEAGGMSRTGQIYVCSAILNLSEQTGKSIWELAHAASILSVAPYVDRMKPDVFQYEIIDAVLSGERVPDVCYFRTQKYHSFGIPVCEIEGVYFSKAG